MAEEVAEGARSAGVECNLISAEVAKKEDVTDCDAVIWGAGNYFGLMEGILKDFFDRNYYAMKKMDGVAGKPYAGVTSAGRGRGKALILIDRLAHGMRMKKAFEPVIALYKPSPEITKECRELGRKMAELDPDTVVDPEAKGMKPE